MTESYYSRGACRGCLLFLTKTTENGKLISFENSKSKIKFRFRNKTFEKPIDKEAARVYNIAITE